MRMINMLKNKVFIKTHSIIIIVPLCFTLFASEKQHSPLRPPFRNPLITGGPITSPKATVNSPLRSSPTRPISIPRPPTYDSLNSQGAFYHERTSPQEACFDQRYLPGATIPTTFPQQFIFPPHATAFPSAPPVSEYGNRSEYGDEEDNDEENSSGSPAVLCSSSNLHLRELDEELNTKTNTIILPNPKDLTPRSLRTRFLQKLLESTHGLLVSPKTVSASLKKDQAAELAKLTRKSLEARIPFDIEIEETTEILLKRVNAMRKAREKTQKKQGIVAALALSSSAPLESRIVTSSPTIPLPQLSRGRSKSLSNPTSQTETLRRDMRPE